jgi:hypothetical protein
VSADTVPPAGSTEDLTAASDVALPARGELPRERRAARHVLAGLGVVCAAGVGAVVLVADRARFPASSPIEPGPALRWTLVAAGLAALAAYGAAAVSARRVELPVTTAFAIASAVQLLPLLGPTLLSTDVWTYWMYGRIGSTLGGDPYADAPSAFASDVAYGAMGSSWHETTSFYGPLFTLASELDAALVGDSPEAAAFGFRLAAALSMLAVTALAALLSRHRTLAIVLAGWNPLLALHFAGGGHNDALMLAFVLLALVLAERERPDAAGLCWAAAIGVKWVPIAFLALWAIGRRARGLPLGVRGLCAGLAAVALAATVRYGADWLTAFSGLSAQARRTGSIGLSKWLGDLGLGHRPQLVVIALLLAGAFALLALAAWRGRTRLGVAGSALALGQGWLNPWYASWGVALSAPEQDRLAHGLALGLTAFLMLDALPL